VKPGRLFVQVPGAFGNLLVTGIAEWIVIITFKRLMSVRE
jgi:hypothetical protein